MIVELFYTEGCGKCASMREDLKATAQQTIPDVIWKEVDVIKDLDYAVELGVMTLPAIAIDKNLVFTSLPTLTQFAEALQERSRRGA